MVDLLKSENLEKKKKMDKSVIMTIMKIEGIIITYFNLI